MAREQVVWVDADGGQLNLNDWVHYFCTRDQKGIWAPPFTLQSAKTPLSEGSQFRSVVVGERGVDLKQFLKAGSRDELISMMRDLTWRLNPLRGEGQLRFTNGTETRVLYCRPEGIKDVNEKNLTAEIVLSFTANDPFLHDDTVTEILFSTGAAESASFFSTISFFPMRLTRSVVYSAQSVNNPGDAEAFPIWTIQGPGLSIQLTNNLTGKVLSLGSLELISGQELVIDTRIGKKTITVDGVNAFNYLADLSSLWPILPGANSIQIEMSGSSGESSINLEFTPRYESK